MEPHYELVELLGQGGMGSVYRGFHRPSGRAVAIKTLHTAMTTREAGSQILLDEATSAARLDDPRIVRLLDVGRQRDGTPFLVMQLARGVSLDRMIENWAGWASLSKAVLEVLAGLRSAHSAGIIHRDLKPGNVIVDPDDGVARILDFGIAKRFDPLRLEEDDPDAEILGTPEFMPPEQMLGESTGPWTDLYAIGVLLAEIVRGESPFRLFESLQDLVYRKQTYTGAWVTRPGLEVPDALQHLIDRLLQPLPRARPRFAGEVAGELQALIADVVDRVTHVRRTSEHPRSAFLDLVGGFQSEPPLAPFSEPLPLPAKLPAGPADPLLRSSLTGLRELRLVGRSTEREELMSRVHDVVQDGLPRMLVYVGEPGIGKSRLARWGLEYVERVGAMERAAGGYDAAGADVAGGLRHALRRVVGTPPSPRNQLGWSWLQDPELDHEELTRYLRGDDRETLAVDDVVRIAHATLRAAARLRPIYLWLDDLGWARDGAMQLVLRILDAQDVPILIVATMRSGTRSHTTLAERLGPLMEHPSTKTRTLLPLAGRRRAELIRETANVEASIADEIAQVVEGSPLLLVQLTRDWLQRGLLVPDGEVYRTAEGASVASLLDERPLSALIRDRMARILEGSSEHAEPILRRAALLGARFDLEALRFACGELGDAVPAVIDHALLVGVVRAEGDAIYAFDHAMVREVLLDEAQEDRRACVDAANGLLRCYGKERTDIAALVAELLHRAGDYERAWERLLRAITRAAWAGDDGQARHHLERAETWLELEPSRKPHVALAEADVHSYARRFAQGLACVARARSATDDPLMLARCDAHEADILFHLGRLAESSTLAAALLAANEDDPDPDRLMIAARAAARLGALAALRDELDEALTLHQRSSNLSKHAGDTFGVRIGLLQVARIRGIHGEPDRALREAETVLESAEQARDEAATLAANETIGRILALSGRMERARTLAQQRRRSASVRGDQARATSAALDCALVASEPAELEHETMRFLDAFTATPHDHPSTVAGMERLTILLVGRGMKALADEVKELLKERSERIDRGFEGR